MVCVHPFDKTLESVHAAHEHFRIEITADSDPAATLLHIAPPPSITHTHFLSLIVSNGQLQII